MKLFSSKPLRLDSQDPAPQSAPKQASAPQQGAQPRPANAQQRRAPQQGAQPRPASAQQRRTPQQGAQPRPASAQQRRTPQQGAQPRPASAQQRRAPQQGAQPRRESVQPRRTAAQTAAPLDELVFPTAETAVHTASPLDELVFPTAETAVHTASPGKDRPQEAATAPKQTKKRRKKKKKKSLARRLVTLLVTLAVLAGLYLTAVYSNIPFIAKWRTAYIETAMNTLNHKWLATAFIPRSVIDEVMANLEQAREDQIGVNSEWDKLETIHRTDGHRNSTLTDTTGMTQEEVDFFDTFWEIDVPSMLSYVDKNPTVLSRGWGNIDINEAGLDDSGTSIRTVFDEQVLAIDAQQGVLIARVKGGSYRGLIVIAKDPSRLSLQAATSLGSYGQHAGVIAEAHNGILAMTGSGFIDEGGVGNGGSLAGYCMCDGKAYGTHMGRGFKRLELHADDRIYIRDCSDPVSADTTDAVEFSPAMIIDGKIVVPSNGFTDLQPRACLGQSQYGEIIMLLVEGRLPGTSIGISVPDCAEIMLKHDCAQAMNLDGGTSAMIWYKGEYIMRSSNPALSAGRPLPNAFVYAKK